MGVAYERGIQNMWWLGVPRTGLRTTDVHNAPNVTDTNFLKGTYYAPFYKMKYWSWVSPECVCEVSAQNTQQIIYYNSWKIKFFGCV